MAVTKFTLLLYIISTTTTLFFFQPTNATDPLYHICSSFSSKPTPSYKSNLNTLLTILTSKTPPTGFSLASYPSTPSPSTAYALALCRGDTSPSTCRTCVHNASSTLPSLCPDNKAAVIWYDNCLIKYSDESFFGLIDTQNKFTLVNVFTISNNPELFKTKVKSLLANLTAEATGKEKGKVSLYADGEVKLDTFTNLYGLVQCTRDLSREECRKCLDEVVGEFPGCCDAKQGGRVVAASCNFRYEIYPFVDDSS